MFSHIAFIDYGYFFDGDNRWYYVIPGPFRIKLPLELVGNHLDEQGYEFGIRDEVESIVVQNILESYRTNQTLREQLSAESIDNTQVEAAVADCHAQEHPVYHLFGKYRCIFRQFDDWVFVKTDKNNTAITDIIMKLKDVQHIETINW